MSHYQTKDDVYRSLERCRCAFLYEGYSRTVKYAMMRSECRIIEFLVVHLYLPVAKVGTLRGKYRCFARRIDALIPLRDGIASHSVIASWWWQ